MSSPNDGEPTDFDNDVTEVPRAEFFIGELHGSMWKCHPHDNGFNFDADCDADTYHEFGRYIGKYHTPCIAFDSTEARDAAWEKIRGEAPKENE